MRHSTKRLSYRYYTEAPSPAWENVKESKRELYDAPVIYVTVKEVFESLKKNGFTHLLPTYEDVVNMAYEVLKPHFRRVVCLLDSGDFDL